jgi:YHS domain-containing protein
MTLTALAALAGAGFAKPAASHPAKPPVHAKKITALACPVTGEKIASAGKAMGHSSYKGKAYYFCCPACKPKFDKNPAKYIRNSAKGVFEKM